MTVSPALLRVAQAIRIADERAPLAVASTALVLPSVANLREHHHAKAERMKAHRLIGRSLGRRVAPVRILMPWAVVVQLTRVAPRPLDDDNLASALKAVRDGVADALGVDDRDPRVVWLVDQRKGKAAVEVQVFRSEA